MTRRTFLASLAGAGLTAHLPTAFSAPQPAPFLFGVCSDVKNAQVLKSAGFDFIEGGVYGTLRPEEPDEVFEKRLSFLRDLPLPIRSCNGFLPKKWKLTGPETQHGPALEYAATACRRADQVGIPYLVLGSGGARNAPEGFDIPRARAQFIAFCKKLGERIASCRVTVVLEPLNKKEANYLQTVSEGIQMVDQISNPRIQLLGDFFHMRCEGETEQAILDAGKRLRHCHIAEFSGRKAPGTKGESFRDYFAALRKIGYQGGISCECGWPKSSEMPFPKALERAVKTMREQAMG